MTRMHGPRFRGRPDHRLRSPDGVRTTRFALPGVIATGLLFCAIPAAAGPYEFRLDCLRMTGLTSKSMSGGRDKRFRMVETGAPTTACLLWDDVDQSGDLNAGDLLRQEGRIELDFERRRGTQGTMQAHLTLSGIQLRVGSVENGLHTLLDGGGDWELDFSNGRHRSGQLSFPSGLSNGVGGIRCAEGNGGMRLALLLDAALDDCYASTVAYRGVGAPVPEPATLGLAVLSAGGLGLARWRRRKSQVAS
jgi:hypothetical protein